MVGLVFAETLTLTLPQWIAVGLNAAGWLWYYHTPGSAGILPANPLLGGARGGFPRQWLLTTFLTFTGLWLSFWNTWTSIDQQVLFEQARYLSRFDWLEFLDAFAHRPYVEYQPPFYPFWVSRVPLLWLHQIVLFPFGVLCVGLMWELYGRQAALLCATPVFALMIHQPSTDILLFGTLLIVLRLIQLGCRFLAALVYGLTWMLKPLTLLTLPFMLPQLGLPGFLSLPMWGSYLLWSRHWEFGRRQFRFLLHQLMLTSMQKTQSRGTPSIPPSLSTRFRRLIGFLLGTVHWRWQHLGRKAVIALPFYLFPAWLWPWTWKGIILMLVIVFGYGNSKYLLLDLLFLFPVIKIRNAENTPVFRMYDMPTSTIVSPISGIFGDGNCADSWKLNGV